MATTDETPSPSVTDEMNSYLFEMGLGDHNMDTERWRKRSEHQTTFWAGYNARKHEVASYHSPVDLEADIAAERRYQISKGYDEAHDRAHGIDHLLREAQAYAAKDMPIKSMALIEAARELIANPQ